MTENSPSTSHLYLKIQQGGREKGEHWEGSVHFHAPCTSRATIKLNNLVILTLFSQNQKRKYGTWHCLFPKFYCSKFILSYFQRYAISEECSVIHFNVISDPKLQNKINIFKPWIPIFDSHMQLKNTYTEKYPSNLKSFLRYIF